MLSSDESEEEQDVQIQINKLHKEIELQEKKLERIRKKKRHKHIESESAATYQNPVLLTPLQTKEDGDDVSLPDVAPITMHVNEDKEVTACDADERTTPFENEQMGNGQAKMPSNVKSIPDELGSTLRADYTRTGGQCSTTGAMYEVKMLALLYVRASVRDWDFLLGTNVREAGKFDDVTLAYTTDSGVRRQLLVQLGHKETSSISKAKLLAEDSKKHKFSLLKYYKSFRELRDNYATNKVLNSYSQFSDIDFVLFTNAAAEVSEELFTDADLRTTNDSVLNVNGKVFNFSENRTLKEAFKKKYAREVSDETSVAEFFDKFYIFSNQTREEDLEMQTIQEIKISFSLSDYGARKICASLVKYINAWWGNHTESYNLKRGSFLFESGSESEILNECKAESPKLKFSSEALLPIKECLSNDIIKIINCVVDVDTCSPACDKLAQCITETSVQFISVTLEYMESFYENVMCVWPSKLHPILIIKYELEMAVLPNIKEIFALAQKSLDLEKGSKLFLVSKNGVLGNKLFPDDQQPYYRAMNISCEINQLTDECQELVLKKIINFQGSNVSLHSVLEKNNTHAFDACLLSLLMYHDEILKLGLLEKTKPSYYIDRVLARSHFLRKKVLQDSSCDIFAVSGVNKEQLQLFLDMAESQSEAESCNYLSDNEEYFGPGESFNLENMALWYSDGTIFDSTLTAENLFLRNYFRQTTAVNQLKEQKVIQSKIFDERHINTDSTRLCLYIIHNTEDFHKLCMKHESKNVHWLEVQNAKLKWKESKGNRTTIKNYFSNEKFLTPINNVWDIPERIVVITGSSGMGKSTLLAQVAVNSKEKRPETCVIRIDLRECGSYLNNIDSTITPKEACEFLIRKSLLLDECNQSSTYFFFEHIIRYTNKAVVFIDGFDEVYPENESKIADLIKSLLKLSISKLWITTRPHLTSKLEKVTRTISYELQPLELFESENLVNKYLCNEKDDTLTRVKITKDFMSLSLLETPLHCEMLAEAFQSNANIRNALLGNVLRDTAGISTLSLLEAVVERKFEIFFQKHKNLIPENKQVREMFEKRKQFIENHQRVAILYILSIGLIKPHEYFNESEINRTLESFINAVKTGSGVTGMIQSVRDGKPIFEHQIYAEYFLALWMMENRNGTFSYITKLILQRIIFEQKFMTIIWLFNQMASKGSAIHDGILQNDWNNETLPEILTLKKVPDVNAKDKAGKTALHLALSLWNNHKARHLLLSLTDYQEKLISKLFRLGAKPDINDDILDWSPFRFSNIRTVPWNIVGTMMKERGIVESDMNELIERVQTQKLDALAGLAYSVRFENSELVSFLLKNGVDVNERVNEMGDTAIIIAAAHGQREILKFLHKECFAKPELGNYNGDSPLHWACLRGHLKIVKYLINKCRIDPNIKNNSLYTPLLAAARSGHLNIIDYLIVHHSSNPRERTKFGQSALCLAAGSKGDGIQTVKYLVEECGLNPKECSKNGCLPVNIACMSNNFRITKFLVDKFEIDLLEKNENGYCSLHSITPMLPVERIEELFSLLKLSLNCTDGHGHTLFMWSLIFPRPDLCEYLRTNCTNIKYIDAEGNTALQFYINCGYVVILDMVKWLVEICHIDPNVVNISGLTALQCAVLRSQNNATICFIQPGVIEYLRNKT